MLKYCPTGWLVLVVWAGLSGCLGETEGRVTTPEEAAAPVVAAGTPEAAEVGAELEVELEVVPHPGPEAVVGCGVDSPDPDLTAGVEAPLGWACTAATSAGTKREVVAAVVGPELLVLANDGTARTLHRFGGALAWEDPRESSPVVVARGDYIAAAEVLREDWETDTVRVELVVFHRDGTRLVELAYETGYESSGGTGIDLVGNAAGMFGLYHGFGDNKALLRVGADGQLGVRAAGLIPRTDPGPDGVLLVQGPVVGGAYSWLWHSLCDGSSSPALYDGQALRGGTHVHDGGLLYPDLIEPAVVLERAAGAQRIEMPGAGRVSIVDVHPSGWVLLSTEEGRRWVVSLQTGERRVVDIAYPEPLFQFYWGDPPWDLLQHMTVGSGGVLGIGLRDAGLGWLHTSSDGRDWQARGLPVHETIELTLDERAGTWVVNSYGLGATDSNWSAPPADVQPLAYQSLHMVRPADGFAQVIHDPGKGSRYNHGHFLSDDGGCLVCWPGKKRLMLRNASDGQTLEIPVDHVDNPQQVLAWTWLPALP